MSDIEQLRRKIARWHLAFQQRYVDREWPALGLIMQEMERESNIGNDAPDTAIDTQTTPREQPPATPSGRANRFSHAIVTLPNDQGLLWARLGCAWHAFGEVSRPTDKSVCRRMERSNEVETAKPGSKVVGMVCGPCYSEWCMGGRRR